MEKLRVTLYMDILPGETPENTEFLATSKPGARPKDAKRARIKIVYPAPDTMGQPSTLRDAQVLKVDFEVPDDAE